ncbi:PotD/PotF family extracellular solute-binding protein [Pseudanabaena sp. 'Roaring Creek']|uniref:ABC transporter substrate-binding protein n=1 Tax=Pseudanabaena sp. 'Roaring Creek' TaxID=1681830 RepID=UPI0006D79BE5|nr:spermidine/putrescine ABC transporter substrate-binding protein [Pseudanabaena sp. 'Roaring Creek']
MLISRRKFLRQTAYATSAIASASTLAACGIFDQSPSTSDAGGEDVTRPATQDKKTLYLYGWATYVNNQEVLEGFTKETGIKVVGDAYDANEVMLAKLETSNGRSGYSIIYPSDYMVSQMRDKKLLAPLNKKLLPNLTNIATNYLELPHDRGAVFSIPVSLGTTGIAYNVEAVKSIVGEEPTDWSYLWQHKNKLRITLVNDPREVIGMALHTLGYSYNSKEETQIEHAFQKLRELMPAIANFSTDAWRDPLASGDLMMCMAFSGDAISLSRQNPNVKYVLPNNGTSIWTDTIAIPRGAPNIEGAHAWINYVMKPEIAAKISDANSFGTTNKLAKSLIPDDLKAIKALEPSETIIAKCDRITKLEPEALQIYDGFWTRLTTGLG